MPLVLTSALALAQSVQLVDPSKANLPKQGQAASAKPAAQRPLLPASFGGWRRQAIRAGTDPAQFDSTNAVALKEYGFSDFVATSYKSGGRELQVRAARFADAGGAFGAFSFLRQPGDHTAGVGDDFGTTAGGILFYRGNILVEADPAYPIADLRALAASLPQPVGAAASLPSLPSYLPKQALQNIRYFAGPVAAAIDKLPLSPVEVRWDDGAEVVWAQRSFGAQNADLILISYPNPQMAAARLRDLQAAIVKDQAPGITRLARRSGPIVVWVSGAITPAEAQALARSVSYDAKITWDEPNPLSRRENVGELIVAALALAGVILLMSLVAGLAFGGFRILMKRLYPDRVFDRSQDVEIIRLHLTE